MGRPRDACLPPPPPVGRQGAEGPPVFPPAPLPAGQRKPRIAQWRRGAPLRTYPTGQSSTLARERRPPVGTAARSAAKPRIAQWRCSAPLRTYSTGQSGAQARERRPPVGTRWPPASARRIAEWRCGAPLRTYPTGQSSTQARERRPPAGTAARRAAAAPPPTVGMAPFSARTPPGRAARRQGNADLWAVLPVGPGTAARRAAAAPPPTVGMVPFSARTPPGRAARRPGNADLRSAQRPTGPRRRRPQPSGWLPSRRVPHRAEQHAGKGTPTSGRHRCAKRSERRVPRSRPDDAERRGPGREANHPELGVLPCRPPEAGERRTLDGPDGPPAPVHFREGHACRHPARRSTT